MVQHTEHGGLRTHSVSHPGESELLPASARTAHERLHGLQSPDMHNAEISKRLGKRWKMLRTREDPVHPGGGAAPAQHMADYPDYKYGPRRSPRPRGGAGPAGKPAAQSPTNRPSEPGTDPHCAKNTTSSNPANWGSVRSGTPVPVVFTSSKLVKREFTDDEDDDDDEDSEEDSEEEQDLKQRRGMQPEPRLQSPPVGSSTVLRTSPGRGGGAPSLLPARPGPAPPRPAAGRTWTTPPLRPWNSSCSSVPPGNLSLSLVDQDLDSVSSEGLGEMIAGNWLEANYTDLVFTY
uniref:SRY-box transcription factor 11b n=1 Tax=Labrus bergylta TaxID=56723 RepID=A0A3Q3LLM4_9LABR